MKLYRMKLHRMKLSSIYITSTQYAREGFVALLLEMRAASQRG